MFTKARLHLLVLTAVVAMSTGCTSSSKISEPAMAAPLQLPLITVSSTKVTDYGEAIGTIRATQSSAVAAQVMGALLEVRVREGQRVARGEILAVVDDAQPRAARIRAEAAVAAAEQQAAGASAELGLAAVTLKRYEDLFAKKSVSPQEFDEVKARHSAVSARVESARAAVAQARAELRAADVILGQTRIRAPFAGIVTERKFDPGALAVPGTPLLTIEDDSSYRVDATVDESEIRVLRQGTTVAVLVDALSPEPLEGTVAQIIPAADSASRSFLVKVTLKRRDGLRSGLFARVRFSRGEKDALLIPREALVTRGQLRGAFVLDQTGIARLAVITVGKEQAGQVEVLSGLAPGQRLVARATGDISGRKVEVR